MNYPPYPFVNLSDADEAPIYQFRSISKDRTILKLVLFTKLDENTYNVALVDITDDEELSDTVVSNNHDLKAVPSTVVQIMLDFLLANPTVALSIEGSTLSRTRLYRIVIATYFDELSLGFQIDGTVGTSGEPFKPNKPYDRFLIQKQPELYPWKRQGK